MFPERNKIKINNFVKTKTHIFRQNIRLNNQKDTFFKETICL